MSTSVEAERSLELAERAMADSDVDALVAHLSAAIRGFTAAADPRRSAMACAQLGDVMANYLGNVTAARAWFERAARMIAAEPPCVEQGWVAIAAMGCDVGDPEKLLERAELALERARRFGDINLETKALADAGLAHVQAGRVVQGMAMLDEAMALACGPADDVDVAGKSACSLFTACYYTADFERAASWGRLLRQHGIIGPESGAPIFLSNHCDAVHACLLCELGRWTEAENLLVKAAADFEAAMGQPGWHPTILLADLRIRQGRYTDAEMLLLGKDQAFEALLPAARLHLRRGDHDMAAAMVQRGLRALGSDRPRAVELLTVLVEAELARGENEAALRACAELEQRIAGLDSTILHARAAAARARVLVARGEPDEAAATLEAAVDRLGVGHAPWQRVRLLVELARLHETLGDHPAARIDAKSAATILSALDVVLEPEDRALIDRLAPAETPSEVLSAALTPQGKWWVVSSSDGMRVRLRHTKGLHYLAELISNPGVERHVLDLVDRVEGPPASGTVDRRALGDAGEMLDGRARSAYRHRIEELRAESDDALAVGDLDRAEAIEAELDALVQQLALAFGLGGRNRRAASAVERARLNVTRALRAAITKIVDALPEAGSALDRGVRTGRYCAYVPDDGDARWTVEGSFRPD